MKITMIVLAGALSLGLFATDASAGWLEDFINKYKNRPNHSVPEPSSLYAVGSALALLGGAGWLLRRK